MSLSQERLVLHPYRLAATFAGERRPAEETDAFAVSIKLFLAGLSLVRACLDVTGGELTTGGAGALALLWIACSRPWE